MSPSFAAPGVFPAVHELAMRTAPRPSSTSCRSSSRRRVKPTPRRWTAQRDLLAAFGDPTIDGGAWPRSAVTTRSPCCPTSTRRSWPANPKPFFGYSDNTNLLNWLWNLGIVGYHGGSTMVHLGRGAGLHPGLASARCARRSSPSDEVEVTPVEEFGEDEVRLGRPRRR